MVRTPAQVQILVRTSSENRDWLKKSAVTQERSVNWLIHKLLTEARLSEDAQESAVQ